MPLITKFSLAVCMILFPAVYAEMYRIILNPIAAFVVLIVLGYIIFEFKYPSNVILLLLAFSYTGYSGATNVWEWNKVTSIPLFLVSAVLPFLAIFVLNKKYDSDIEKVSKEIANNKSHTKNKYITDGVITSINYLCKNVTASNKLEIYKQINEIAFLAGILDKNDLGMILPEDLKWFVSFSEEHVGNLRQHYDLYRLGLFKSELDRGMSQENAATSVVKRYPYFYIETRERQDMPVSSICYTDDDMKLPFIISPRIAKFNLQSYLDRNIQEVDNFSSCNALIRSMIRKGKI